ncbi:MAG: glycoside hydrolase family protein [Hyphococcus sp.]
MRSHLLFWFILFALGALVGERYGLPGMITGVTDRGFEQAESWLGRQVSEAASPADDGDKDAAPAYDQDKSDDQAAGPAGPSGSDGSDLGHPENAGLRINAAGLQIIKESEGLRLEAYTLNGQWLIGYGHARTARAGMTITEAEAEALLREDVRDAEDGVRQRVTAPVNENQFSAMVSLAYNLGVGGFSRSTVLDAVNRGDYRQAADNFLNHNRAGGVPNEHLTHRREQERALFLTPV